MPEHSKTRFPYGIADFRALIEEGYYYADRTDRIARVEQEGKQLLLLRPRRFGKSLWLSTLENYYDLARADAFESLFGRLAVGRSPTPKRNAYFVLKLNFSGIDPQGDAEAIGNALHQHINSEIDAFNLYYEDHLPRLVKQQPNAFSSFRNLLAVVQRAGRKLYLLIDEYDNFANQVMISHQRGSERYQELVEGEGIIKTFFKVVKLGAEGPGLDRVFITGVSPVVMSDITSGYNVVTDITHLDAYHDLCGLTADELTAVVKAVVEECRLPSGAGEEALATMRTFYNGYRFGDGDNPLIYNPTLALYFLHYFGRHCRYPERMLDENLAMDRSRIQYVARLPHGQGLITQALAQTPEEPGPITIDQLFDRFGVEAMLATPLDHAFLASLLYYFGVLTRGGRDAWGKLHLAVPNLVVRSLYVEQLKEALLPAYEDKEQCRDAADRFYAQGELAPLCDLIEQRYFKVFDNRDLRWSNELVVKTAFLILLFNDTFYVMDSETAIERGYGDLTLILRPDMRRYRLFDHLLEFKHVSWKDLQAGSATSVEREKMGRQALRELPAVKARLDQARAQLARYRKALEQAYGERLKLRTHAVVCVGLERLVW